MPAISFASLFRSLAVQPLNWLVVALPVSIALRLAGTDDLWVFLASALAIVPLAGLMGQATEHLASKLGAGIGGLLNATFGNAAELIIALAALRKGPQMYPLVKASITGSIIGNVLLVLGAALTAGGFFHRRQTFNRTAASMGATLLALSAVGLIMPTLYYYTYLFTGGHTVDENELHMVELLSDEIAAVLAAVYVLSLIFTLFTHRNLFSDQDEARPQPHSHGDRHKHSEEAAWSRAQALVVLLLSTIGVAAMSEQLVQSVEAAAHSLGMSQVFVGVIVVAIVGNAAEHSTAVLMAIKNKMDLAVNIAVGSSLQIALFVAPVLVFASMAMGHPHTLDLHFTPMEIIAVVISIVVLAMVSQDGESHWLEGVMLLAVYAILALAFYHLPEAVAGGQ